ncbi:VOC family protein [Paraburkholderia bannensis]|uniref:VOC family protein n=1 Tax=Paraburkholderia bannensis TaxID=765414 RepID=UPI002AB6B86B|nr:VOC family protein [Paraburkholderia bannensis]
MNSIALAVENLDAMVAWYETMFGLNVAERGQFVAVGANYAMLDGAGVRLELVSRTDTLKRPVDRTVPPKHLDVLGWKALVLDSDDLAATTAGLIERRAEVVWADLQLSPSLRSTMIRDPEGNLINILGHTVPA